MPDATVRDRLRTAFELYEVAEKIMLQNLRRRFPDATEEQIEERFRHWLGKNQEPDSAPWKIRRNRDR